MKSASTKMVQEDGSPERLAIDTIVTVAIGAVQKANSGHAGTPMAMAPVAHTLWRDFIRYDPGSPDWPNRSTLLYTVRHLAGVKEINADGKPTGKPAAKLPEDECFDLNLTDIAEVCRRGCVICSWLPDLSAAALAKDQLLERFWGKVADSGEGHWTIEAAMEEAVPANLLAAALFSRYRSRVDTTFSDKLLSAMRFGFGSHVEMPQ